MKPALSLIAAALLAATAAQAAEPFPSKVIRMVVPLAPGGTGDTLWAKVVQVSGAKVN